MNVTNGGTAETNGWGIDNDTGPLRDVLLGRPDHYRWLDAGPIIRRTLQNQAKTGVAFNLQTAMAQHAEMVRIYEDAGAVCHYLEADEVLHRNFFARDSSAMTPWGALICHMQLKCRRADYHSVIRFYQDNNIPIWRYATAGHFEGGDFVILEPGTVCRRMTSFHPCASREAVAGIDLYSTRVDQWLERADEMKPLYLFGIASRGREKQHRRPIFPPTHEAQILLDPW